MEPKRKSRKIKAKPENWKRFSNVKKPRINRPYPLDNNQLEEEFNVIFACSCFMVSCLPKLGQQLIIQIRKYYDKIKIESQSALDAQFAQSCHLVRYIYRITDQSLSITPIEDSNRGGDFENRLKPVGNPFSL